jgi:hypothetical protein
MGIVKGDSMTRNPIPWEKGMMLLQIETDLKTRSAIVHSMKAHASFQREVKQRYDRAMKMRKKTRR